MLPSLNVVTEKFAFTKATATSVLFMTVLALGSVTLLHFTTKKEKPKITKGPLSTLIPFLNEEEKSALPYPPDVFPGGRDIQSPVSLRVIFAFNR
jgi:hypothetical protein